VSGTRLARDEASVSQITEHLRCCETDFIPPLAQRTDLDDYARKIAARAVRFEAWAGDTLVGLVAVYCNEPDRRVAFVTSVSVVPEHQGRGVAATLLASAIEDARREGFERMALEVGPANAAAVRLYSNAGFTMGIAKDGMVRMDLELQVTGKTGSQP
jgi:ribosomal protein S18 acetylase RimI-like enzyme